jgi:hypothetical protein
MDKLSDRELEKIESRLEAFGEFYERLIEGGDYDAEAALEDFHMLAGDMRRLLEQVRARG